MIIRSRKNRSSTEAELRRHGLRAWQTTVVLAGLVCVDTGLAWGQAGAVRTNSGDAITLTPIELSGAEEAQPTDEPAAGDDDETGEPGNNQVVVTSDQLDRISPANLQDVFRGEPGVSVGSSLPISQKIYVDGIEETNLNVTIDGSRQNNKIFHHNATTYIDPSMLKAVRVDPGVAPADAGPGALGGSIAFETRDATDLLAPGKLFGGFISAGYETNGKTFTTSGSLYGAYDGFEVLGYLKYANGSNFSDGSGREMIGSSADLLSGLGKVAYESQEGHRFSLSYENVRDDAFRPNRADFIFDPPRPNVRYDLNRQNIVFKYTHEKPDGWFDPEVVLAYSVTDLTADPAGIYGSTGMTSSFNGKVQNTFAFDLGTIVAGLDFYRDEAEYSGNSGSVAEQANNLGVFSQARLDLTERARVSFGARGDIQEFTGTNGFSETQSGLSANISGEYDLTDVFTASIGYAHGWGGVRLAEPYLFDPAWDYGDGIKPATSDNVFVGLKADFGDFYLDGRVFRTNIDNARALLNDVSPIQLKDVVSQGYEIGAGYNWGTGFVRVGFADIDAEIDGQPADSYTGRYLATPIGQRFTLGGAHTFAGQLTLGADLEVVLDYDEGAAELPGYTVVNTYLEYAPAAFTGITVRAEVNNLFDETYADRATYGQEFPGEVIPLNEPGRSFALKVTGRF